MLAALQRAAEETQALLDDIRSNRSIEQRRPQVDDLVRLILRADSDHEAMLPRFSLQDLADRWNNRSYISRGCCSNSGLSA